MLQREGSYGVADGTEGCNQLISSSWLLESGEGEWAEMDGSMGTETGRGGREGRGGCTRAGRRRRRAGRRRRTPPAPRPRRTARPSVACPRAPPPALGAASEARGRRAGPTSEPWVGGRGARQPGPGSRGSSLLSSPPFLLKSFSFFPSAVTQRKGGENRW